MKATDGIDRGNASSGFGTTLWRRYLSLSWPSRVGAVAVVLSGVLMIWAWTDAWLSSRRSPRLELVEQRPTADELVVVTHGFTGGRERMARVLDVIRQERPSADIAFFTYPASTFSNTDPFVLANQLEQAIEKVDQPKYRRILLSGHSMGALLMRKAYVYGCGSVEDLPLAGDEVTTRPVKDWCKKVDRIVLLAGVNRGWDPEARPADMGWLMVWRNRLGMELARVTGTARFIRGFRRGEPFVANLRLQWLDTMEKARAGKEGLKMPVVVQLLGDKDDVVSKEDSKDVKVSRDFIWVQVNNTGHASLLQLSETGDGAERAHRIQSAFGGESELAALKRATPVGASETDSDVTTVVFVLHGIRDMGEWTSDFKKPLEAGFAGLHPGTTEKIVVHRPDYGYFPMGSFLILGDRQRNVRWFMDEVTELRAKFPGLRAIHFIGHSNGTYVMASALEQYKTLKVGRVVFAGSVVRRDFRWNRFVGRVDKVRNYVGSADWVVGLFPKLFELPGFRMFNPDLGSAGFNGFEDASVKDGQTQFIAGGHACALDKRNIPSIVNFILHGDKTEAPELLVSSHPGFLDLLSRICWVVWLGLLVVLGFVGWRLPRWIHAGFSRFFPTRAWSLRTMKWTSRLAYLGLLWLVLVTV